MSPDRHYGTDSTDEFDTLAEVTLNDDGTLNAEVVILDKRDQIESAGADDSPTTGSGPEVIAADEPSWPRFRLWGRR